jgi:hypothetical protein
MTDFIHTQYIDKTVCDELIEYFENNTKKFEGLSAYGVDKDIKDSIDCYLEDESLTNKYVQQLRKVAKSYVEKYPFADHYAQWGIIDSINIQKYDPGGGFKVWHTERAGPEGLQASRHLVFMTYLNDVEDGGETEFFHQQRSISPQKGLTVIWPADWTHTHRGVPSPTETKYIITGWFNF